MFRSQLAPHDISEFRQPLNTAASFHSYKNRWDDQCARNLFRLLASSLEYPSLYATTALLLNSHILTVNRMSASKKPSHCRGYLYRVIVADSNHFVVSLKWFRAYHNFLCILLIVDTKGSCVGEEKMLDLPLEVTAHACIESLSHPWVCVLVIIYHTPSSRVVLNWSIKIVAG